MSLEAGGQHDGADVQGDHFVLLVEADGLGRAQLLADLALAGLEEGAVGSSLSMTGLLGTAWGKGT
jgi:hypothetical protein